MATKKTVAKKNVTDKAGKKAGKKVSNIVGDVRGLVVFLEDPA